MESVASAPKASEPWNKGKLVGQKTPFKLKEIWAIRVRLQIARRCRDLALFDLAIDSKLRACDLTQLRVRDVLWCPIPIVEPKNQRSGSTAVLIGAAMHVCWHNKSDQRVARWVRGASRERIVDHPSFAIHFTSSISLGRQVLSIQGCSGPYTRSMANQLLPGTVANQLPSLPCGAFGAK